MTIIEFPSPGIPGCPFNESADALAVAWAFLFAEPRLLSEVSNARCGAYLLLYTGEVGWYRRARRSPQRSASEPMAAAGGSPLYAGRCASFAGRARRHVNNLSGVRDLQPEQFLMVMLPTVGAAGAAYAEQLAIDIFNPVLNTVVTGLGSRAQGPGRRSVQRMSMFDVLHPGRSTTGERPPVRHSRAELIARVEAHLQETIPDWMTCAPAASVSRRSGLKDSWVRSRGAS